MSVRLIKLKDLILFKEIFKIIAYTYIAVTILNVLSNLILTTTV